MIETFSHGYINPKSKHFFDGFFIFYSFSLYVIRFWFENDGHFCCYEKINHELDSRPMEKIKGPTSNFTSFLVPSLNYILCKGPKLKKHSPVIRLSQE